MDIITLDTVTLVAIILAALIVGGVVVWVLLEGRRRKRLRDRFGPEYDRTVETTGSRLRAESELEKREKRLKQLDIRPLAPEARARFSEEWRAIQGRFVDRPVLAVAEASELVDEVMRARGYPVGDFEQRAADISVDHPRVVENYRAAHELALRSERGDATTEELRQAMVHYRTLFEDLLETDVPQHAEARS